MAKQSSWGIELKGMGRLKKAMQILGEPEAPFLKEAVGEGGKLLEGAVTQRAPGTMAGATDFVGVKGSGASVKALVRVSHPGAKSMEFGRTNYYRGFTNRQQKATGQKFKASPGQKAGPFVGIKKGDQAIGAVKDNVKQIIGAAYEKEWAKLAAGPED